MNRVIFDRSVHFLRDLEKLHMESEKIVEGQIPCKCSLCVADSPTKEESKNLKISKDTFVVDIEANSQHDVPCADRRGIDIVFLLLKLQPTGNLQNPLRILVPDSAFFNLGQPVLLVSRGRDKSFKLVKQRNKLSIVYIRTLFQLKIKDKDRVRFLSKLPTMDFKKSDSRVISTIMSNNNNERKIEFIPKGDKNPSNMFKLRRGLSDAVLCKYTDGTQMILCEFEFLNFIAKRTADPQWKKVKFLQILTKSEKHALIKQSYIKDKPYSLQDEVLKKRANQFIKSLEGSIPKASEDYISNEDEDSFEFELFYNAEKKLAKYLTFKIVRYLERANNYVVHSLTLEFQVNDFNMFLIDAEDFRYTESQDVPYEDMTLLEKMAEKARATLFLKSAVTWEPSIQDKKLDSKQLFYKTNPVQAKDTPQAIIEKKLVSRGKRTADILGRSMIEDFEKKKNEILTKHYNFHEERDHSSDEIFSILYPDSPLKFSLLLEKEDNREILKNFHPPNESYQRKQMKKQLNNSFSYGDDIKITKKEVKSKPPAKVQIKDVLAQLNSVSRRKPTDMKFTPVKDKIYRSVVRAEKTLNTSFGGYLGVD